MKLGIPETVVTPYGTATITKIQDAQPMGEYKKTSLDTRKENADILIKYANGGSFTISVKPNIEISGRGVKRAYTGRDGKPNGLWEVTAAKMNQLQKQYLVECDF